MIFFFLIGTEQMEEDMNHGQHRQAATTLSSGSSQIANQSPLWASSPSDPIGKAYADARNSGCTHAQAIACVAKLQQYMTHHALSNAAYLGAGYAQQQAAYNSYAAARAQVQPGSLIPHPPHHPTELKSEGIRAGEIIAWRGWFILGDDLYSVVANSKWDASKPMEGDAAAGYGIHAYKGPHGPLLDNYVGPNTSAQWVIGEVALWGDVIEHENGYRSQFARVHSLVTWSDKVSPDVRKRISEKYLNVPAFKIEDAA